MDIFESAHYCCDGNTPITALERIGSLEFSAHLYDFIRCTWPFKGTELSPIILKLCSEYRCESGSAVNGPVIPPVSWTKTKPVNVQCLGISSHDSNISPRTDRKQPSAGLVGLKREA